MRIGIDARTLSGRNTGDRTYWHGLIQGLAAIDRVNDYVLYLKQPIDGEPPRIGANFRWSLLEDPVQDIAWMLRRFPAALAEDGVDVAHTQYNIPLLDTRCPVVTTVHDVTFTLFPALFPPRDRWILNALVPRSMRRAAHVIADSECTRRDILRLYRPPIAPTHVTAIALAVDSRFHPPVGGQESAVHSANNTLGLGDAPYLLAVGVLQPRKNLTLLLDAFTGLKQQMPALPHRLVIAGKRGWRNEDLDGHLAAMPENVRREIVWAGYVADTDLPVLYGGATALCYPSLYEGFGLPPLEALACGCPVLCSNTSSLPEVVGEAGILLPPDSVSAWTEALATLLTDTTQEVRLRRLGPIRAAQFSWEETAAQTLKIYEKIYERHITP